MSSFKARTEGKETGNEQRVEKRREGDGQGRGMERKTKATIRSMDAVKINQDWGAASPGETNGTDGRSKLLQWPIPS